MEGLLRLALVLIGTTIVVVMLLEAFNRRRYNKILKNSQHNADADWIMGSEMQLLSQKNNDTILENHPAMKITAPQKNAMDDLLIISVIAKPDNTFASYDLLQAISATGLQFGEMNIFHYYVPSSKGKVVLFSLASATEPGEFDLNHVGDLSCRGLTLFMDLSRVPDPEYAFELMYAAAEQLADDLDGDLRAGQRRVWSDEIYEEYYQKVLRYSEKEILPNV